MATSWYKWNKQISIDEIYWTSPPNKKMPCFLFWHSVLSLCLSFIGRIIIPNSILTLLWWLSHQKPGITYILTYSNYETRADSVKKERNGCLFVVCWVRCSAGRIYFPLDSADNTHMRGVTCRADRAFSEAWDITNRHRNSADNDNYDVFIDLSDALWHCFVSPLIFFDFIYVWNKRQKSKLISETNIKWEGKK